ncbi:MAG: response regulator [Phycisphaerae bacterium]
MAGAKATILLVDDDVDFVQMNRHVLEAAGYAVLCSYDPQEAMKLLADGKPDLVITDLMMKSLDSGFQFSRQVKADDRFKNVPVIIATSVTSAMGMDFRPRTQQDLAAMGVDAYFDKPIPPKALLAKVEELLSRPKP